MLGGKQIVLEEAKEVNGAHVAILKGASGVSQGLLRLSTLVRSNFTAEPRVPFTPILTRPLS